MTVKVLETLYSRMPHSINNHTMKKIQWENQVFWMDKTTDCFPTMYRLSESGNGMILDDFCAGESWTQALKFVEGYLTAKSE